MTPEMHRVHHSVDRRETDSNFGFNLPWWDRLFGTYRAQPALGHLRMTLGIDRFRDPRELWLHRMLWQPLRGDAPLTAQQAKYAVMLVAPWLRACADDRRRVWLLMHREMIDVSTIELALRSLGIWAPVGFIAIYATGTVLFFSGALLGLAGGALFGPLWGTVWNLLGAMLGATIAFLLARTIAGAWVARRLGGRLRRLVDGVSAEGWRFVALMRLVPLVPFNLLNYALGLTTISLPVYVLASLLCMLPGLSPTPGLAMPAARPRREICRPSLWTARPRSARHDRLCAPPVPSPSWDKARLDRVRRIAATACIRRFPLIVDVRQPEEFTAPPGHLPGAVNVPLGRAGRAHPIWPLANSRSSWSARPTGVPPVPRPICWRPACKMFRFFVAARMDGISEGWLSSNGTNRLPRRRPPCLQSAPCRGDAWTPPHAFHPFLYPPGRLCAVRTAAPADQPFPTRSFRSPMWWPRRAGRDPDRRDILLAGVGRHHACDAGDVCPCATEVRGRRSIGQSCDARDP